VRHHATPCATMRHRDKSMAAAETVAGTETHHRCKLAVGRRVRQSEI
jgi:hypothetical protein